MSTSITEAAFLKAVKENLCNDTRDARLAFAIAWESRGAEIEQIAFKALQVMAFDEQRLSEAQAQIAMQAEALKEVRNNPHTFTRFFFDRIDAALSATSETVAAWRAKEIRPLRREVLVLRMALTKCRTSLDSYDDYIDIDAALRDTQATALAYEREVENRGAVKALENLLEQAVEVDTPDGIEFHVSKVVIYANIVKLRASKGEVK